MIFFVLNVELITDSNYFRSTSIIKFQSSFYDCWEDQAFINFLILIIIELIFKIVSTFAWAALYFIIGMVRLKTNWRRPFPLSDEIVWMLYFQLILWISILLNPWVSLFLPILLFLLFKYIKYKLKLFNTAPLKQTNWVDIGNFVLMFLNLTFVTIVIIVGTFMTFTMDHSTFGSNVCGPFKQHTYGLEALETYIYDYKATKIIYKIITFYPLLWLITCILITIYLFKRSHVNILSKSIEKRKAEYK